jgi:uncharacterized membrane protein
MQRARCKLAAEVQALEQLWNVCLACPTTTNEYVVAAQMAQILESFLILLPVSVWGMMVLAFKEKREESGRNVHGKGHCK